ncbi:hypothetical protein F5Y18DRAFT_420971 [Xylariaceae sp. FL1019]|nr:hypothetical protein F5Y18DRAFT_420971 [Xylariaceae sp. FL1019]
MSSRAHPEGHRDWPALEADYWQTTKRFRDREDAKLAHEFSTRQEHVQQEVTELSSKRQGLERDIRDIDARITHQEREGQRLQQEFNYRKSNLAAQRQEEDRSQQRWFERAREGSYPGKENALPKDNEESLPRELPAPDAAGGWTSINGSLRRSTRREAREQKPPSHPGSLFGNVFHNPVEENESPAASNIIGRNETARQQPVNTDRADNRWSSMRPDDGSIVDHARNRPLKPRERRSLPDFPTPSRSPADLPEESSVPKKRSPRNRKALPQARNSATPAQSPDPSSNDVDLTEITRDRLVLVDDGSVITEPAMFAGVPLKRIDESHPFWNPEWGTLESIIQPALDKWKNKLDGLRSNPDAVRHTTFLANRQVNRGQAIMEFMRDGCFHPFQFANRDMIDKAFKTYINYDTIFRLVSVHEELKKFDLDVTPLEWLRHRFYEISMVEGDKFSLSRTMHDLYHDVKLKYLREKHGFGNIGRPSGYKLADKDSTKGGKSKVKKESSTTRRRSRRSISQVDPDAPSTPLKVEESATIPTEYLESVALRPSKRQRMDAQAGQDDLDFDGYTSTDSFSKGRVMHLDFRVHQIKTNALTTDPKVTQYWTWKPEENKFEHQVLRDVRPEVSWGTYERPVDFNCRLDEIKEVHYVPGDQNIAVTTNGFRGDILIQFKRDRTTKRFLSFVQKKGVKLIASNHDNLEEQWQLMRSEVISDTLSKS